MCGFHSSDAAADVAEIVVDRQVPHFVTHRGQRGDHVVLGPPRRRGDVRAFFDGVRRNEVPVHERQDAQLVHAHSATRCRPLCR